MTSDRSDRILKAMTGDLSPVIAATAHWLTTAYPSSGALRAALAQAQARQAVTIAAWLRYPTALDAELVVLVGPGGSRRLDWLAGSGPMDPDSTDQAWRSWVDEVVASWAACLLADTALARAAISAVGDCAHADGVPRDFRRLLCPDPADGRAASLLRHPDLLAPVAELHREELLDRLYADTPR
jgi:hypothetical protein